MREEIEKLIDDFTREIVQTCASWDENTPIEFPQRTAYVEAILRRFIKDYIEIIFRF